MHVEQGRNESKLAGKYSQILLLPMLEHSLRGGLRINFVRGQEYSSSRDRYRMTLRYPACLQTASISSAEISSSPRPRLRNVLATRAETSAKSALNLRR